MRKLTENELATCIMVGLVLAFLLVTFVGRWLVVNGY